MNENTHRTASEKLIEDNPDELHTGKRIYERKVNLGCGEKQLKDWENYDLKDFDMNKFPYPLKESEYDEILLRKVLEHLTDVKGVLKECIRIAKTGCIITIVVPYYNHKGAFNDVEHIHWFNEHSFSHINIDGLRMESLDKIPTWMGKCFPWIIREYLSVYINSLYRHMIIKFRVLK